MMINHSQNIYDQPDQFISATAVPACEMVNLFTITHQLWLQPSTSEKCWKQLINLNR